MSGQEPRDSGQLSHSGTFSSGFAAGIEGQAEPVDELVIRLNVAVTTCSIYPTTHPKAAQAVDELRESVSAFLHAENGRTAAAFSLLVVERELAIDGKPWRRSRVLCANLLRALERHSIERLTTPAGINVDAIVETVLALTTPQGPESTDVVEVGRLELLEGGEGDPTLGALTVENRVDALRTVFDDFIRGRQPAYRPFGDAVSTLVDALDGSDQLILVNTKIATDGDRLFRHSLGTALGSYVLARSLGIGGDVLREIVAGALLHDSALLNKGDFDDNELWTEWADRSTKHPVLAAGRLALATELPPLVFLIALQHHRKIDGSGFPPTQARMNLATAIVAVADAWDILFNLCGTMPHAVRWRFAQEQLGLLAGTELQEDLVALFLRILGERPQHR